VIVLLPAAIPVTRPVELTVATDGLEEFQVADDVTFVVTPGLAVSVAVSCEVVPAAKVDPSAVTAIESDGGVVPQPLTSKTTSAEKKMKIAWSEALRPVTRWYLIVLFSILVPVTR
jgi:hypothetical protein